MRVTPVSLTQSLIPGVTTLVELVAYCARVSAPGNQDNVATSRRLLDYLIGISIGPPWRWSISPWRS